MHFKNNKIWKIYFKLDINILFFDYTLWVWAIKICWKQKTKVSIIYSEFKPLQLIFTSFSDKSSIAKIDQHKIIFQMSYLLTYFVIFQFWPNWGQFGPKNCSILADFWYVFNTLSIILNQFCWDFFQVSPLLALNSLD